MKYKGTKIDSLVNVDEARNTANVLLYGVIGKDINGDHFARDLVDLSQFGFDTVKININSIGGSIFQGYSILNAMNIIRMNGGKVETYAMGVVDSMAGIILAFGDRGSRSATSFSSGVIHEPLYEDDDGNLVTIDQLPEGGLKNEANFMRDSLLVSLANSTGKTREELAAVMKEGKRRSAVELKAFGMIDNIIEASNQLELSNLSPVEMMAACSKVVISPNNTNKKDETMKLVNQKLGLNSEASESAVAEAIQKLMDKAAAQETKLSEKDAEIQKLKNTNQQLENEKAEAQKAAVESFVDAQIEAGKFNKEKREDLVNQANKDFDGFKTICKNLNGQFVDVTKDIKGPSATSSSGGEKMVDLAKKYHEADMSGTLTDFKNEVGEKKFSEIEDFYVDNMEKIIED